MMVETENAFSKIEGRYPVRLETDFPVEMLVQPKEDLVSRELDEQHANTVYKSMAKGIAKNTTMVAVLFFNSLTQEQKNALHSFGADQGTINWNALKDPANGIKLEVIAGAHRTWALQKLMSEHPEDAVYKTWPVKVVVVDERTPDAIELLVDYGVKENAVSGTQLQMTTFEIIKNMRRTLKAMDMISKSEADEEALKRGGGHWGFGGKFKEQMIKRFKNSSYVSPHSIDPLYQIARMPDTVFDAFSAAMKSMPSVIQQAAFISAMREVQGLGLGVRRQILEDFVRSGSESPGQFRQLAQTTKKVKRLQEKVVEVTVAFRDSAGIVETSPTGERMEVPIQRLDDVERLYPSLFSDSFYTTNVSLVSLSGARMGVDDAFSTVVREALDRWHKVSESPM